jgi:hypothetical protein
MKVEDPKKRRRLAEQVARGELTLIKLRDKIEGRRPRPVRDVDDAVDAPAASNVEPAGDEQADADGMWAPDASPPPLAISDDSLVNAKQSLVDAVDELVGVLGSAEVRAAIGATDRANLAKYLTIAKLRLENAIAMVRSDDN